MDMKKTTKVLIPGILDSEQSKAVLSHDPIGNLPNSFTICSTVMAPSMFQGDEIVFLYLLDKDGNYWFHHGTDHIQLYPLLLGK